MPGTDWKETLEAATSKLDIDNMPQSGVINPQSYKDALKRITSTLEDDKAILAQASQTLYGNHTESRPGENGDKFADTFTQWRDQEAPSVTAVLLDAADKMGIDKDEPAFQAALMTSVAAEVALQNDYHDNSHFREVVTASIRLAVTNNELAAQGEPGVELLDGHDLAKTVLAAAGHDLNHDGNNNSPNGQHTQYLLEQQSLDTMQPYMDAAGMNAQDMEDVRTIIRVTDVSAPQGGKSPHQHLKATAQAARDGGFKFPDFVDMNVDELPAELKALGTDPKLLQMASIMSDADLTPSAGTNYDFNQRMTVAMHAEAPAIKPGPATTEFFCGVIVGGEFSSAAGRAHMQTSLDGMISTAKDLRQQLEADMKAGVDAKQTVTTAPPAQKKSTAGPA